MATNYGAWTAGMQAAGSGSQNARLLSDIMDTRRQRRMEDEKLKLMKSAQDRAQANADRAYALELLKLNRGAGAPAGIRLKPGERYVPETDTVEAIPGSALYQEMSGKAAKDAAIYGTITQKTKQAQDAIDAFLTKKGAVESQFGAGYTGQLTKYTDPGARAALAGIRNILTGAGLEKMRSSGGIGQITEREWPLILGQMTKITESMNEEDARAELANVRQMLDNAQTLAEELYNREWGNTPYIRPMRSGAPMGAPGGTQTSDPMGMKEKLRMLREKKAAGR